MIKLIPALVAYSLVIQASVLDAGLIIDSGQVSVGADFGSSASTATPPARATSSNVFYASANLASQPSGSFPAQGPAEGWASASWNVSGGTNPVISASGSSGQGFNGALGPGGWIYGWGHSSLNLDVSLDQAYAYSAAPATSNVTGVSGTTGWLPAASYSFSGGSYGNGSWAVNLKLSTLSSAESQIFQSVNLTPSIAPFSVNGGSREGISATFAPNAASLAAAAAALGGDHFNWQQTIVSTPSEWQITVNGMIVKEANGPLPSGGIVDPPALPSSKSIFNAITGSTGQVYYPPTNPDGSVFSPNGTDYYSDNFVRGLSGSTAFEWSDSPSWNTNILLPGESVGFRTQLVLEDANDNVIGNIGAPIYWYADQTSSGSFIHESTVITQSGLEPATGGGIYLGEAPVPEPSTSAFGCIIGVAVLLVRCASRNRINDRGF